MNESVPRKVAVIGGGESVEHDVSLHSAADVADALRSRGYAVTALTIGRDGVWQVSTAPESADPAPAALGQPPAMSLASALELMAECDAIFPALHGPGGEDGTIAALASLMGIPCAASPLAAGAIAMDKWVTKLVAEARGIRTAPGVLVLPDDDTPAVTLPVVVKPVAAGSSYGVSLVTEEFELTDAIKQARAVDSRVIIEEFVRGREIDIAVLQNEDGSLRCGPPLEIGRVENRLFDTDQKYDGSADFHVPADVDEDTVRALQDAAFTLFRALGCRGIARVDFFVDDEGIVLNEINTMPGLTEFSQVPRIFAVEGLAYADVMDLVVREAIAR